MPKYTTFVEILMSPKFTLELAKEPIHIPSVLFKFNVKPEILP